jgi:hypothetical protein
MKLEFLEKTKAHKYFTIMAKMHSNGFYVRLIDGTDVDVASCCLTTTAIDVILAIYL